MDSLDQLISINSKFLMPNSTQDAIHYPRAATLAAGIFASLFFPVGVIGNSMTILALLKSKKLRSHLTTWFVLNLSLSDLIFSLFDLPLLASRYLHDDWIHGETLCRLWSFFHYTIHGNSLMSLLAVTINRYVLIVHYNWYGRIFNSRNVLFMIGSVWTGTLFIMMFPLWEVWGAFGWDTQRQICTVIEKDGWTPKYFIFLFFIFVPFVTMIYCYTRIFIRVRESRLNLQAHSAQEPGQKREGRVLKISKEELQLTKMLLLLFCSFITCYIPLMVVSVTDLDTTYPTSYIVGVILIWSSGCTNFIFYAICNKQYRRAYRDLWCCKSSAEASSSQTPMVNSTPVVSDANSGASLLIKDGGVLYTRDV